MNLTEKLKNLRTVITEDQDDPVYALKPGQKIVSDNGTVHTHVKVGEQDSRFNYKLHTKNAKTGKDSHINSAYINHEATNVLNNKPNSTGKYKSGTKTTWVEYHSAPAVPITVLHSDDKAITFETKNRKVHHVQLSRFFATSTESNKDMADAEARRKKQNNDFNKSHINGKFN